MIGAIFAKTQEKAMDVLYSIAKGYENVNMYIIKQHHNSKESAITFSNNDTWYAYRHNGSNSCGRRFNIVYIDDDFLDDEKFLLGTCATLPPYTGITYFR